VLTGRAELNADLTEKYHRPPLSWGEYLSNGHFVSATFENWESEFLQMGMYVLLTVFLRQKGSPDSRPLNESQEAKTPKITGRSPWPVRKGGIWLQIYQHSLSLAYCLLFLGCLGLHILGSWKQFNFDQSLDNLPPETLGAYLGNSKVWFESFQNWQSEFLSVISLILLGTYLREKNSPESKAVEDPHDKTGK